MEHTGKNMVQMQDTTKIGSDKWSDIRVQAMAEGFEESKKFKDYAKEEQIRVKQLVAAQKAQGDMGALRPKKTAQFPYEGESKQASIKMKQLALTIANKVVFDFMTHL